jgi:ATP synthase protein I
MGNSELLIMQKAAFRLAAWQLVITALVSAVASWVGGSDFAVSALIGGSIGIVAGLYQALRMFRIDASKDPDGFLRSVYVGEAIKILLTVALMLAAIRVLNVSMLPFMIGYIAIYVVYWMALKTGFPWIKAQDQGRQT